MMPQRNSSEHNRKLIAINTSGDNFLKFDRLGFIIDSSPPPLKENEGPASNQPYLYPVTLKLLFDPTCLQIKVN